MSPLDRNLAALSVCYRILSLFVGLSAGLFGIVMLLVFTSGSAMAVIVFGSVLAICLAFAVAVFTASGALENRNDRKFCLVMAWLICTLFPLGTVLGVFTIIQLLQPEAVHAFGETESAAPVTAPDSEPSRWGRIFG